MDERKFQPNPVSFWRRQAYQIKEGGLPILLPKFLFALRLASVIPIVLILRALRPLVLVRFGALVSHHIGLFAGNTDIYLSERDAGLQPKRTIDIFYHSFPISNQQLKTRGGRTLRVSKLGKWLYLANNRLPGGSAHVIPFLSDFDFNGVIPRSRAHLSFTPEEEDLGQETLQDLGLPEGAPFVCIYGRDTAYKERLYPNQDDSRHDYRNVSIHNYLRAAEELVRRGYYVIRMGAEVGEALRTTSPMIIDYATTARSEFMDIFLTAKCRFFLGCTGGLINVARLFRRPVIGANFVPLVPDDLLTRNAGDLVIPKKLWLREEGRFMTFREFLEFREEEWSVRFSGLVTYEHLGVDVVENTPEELFAVAIEMDERLKGTWQTTEEDAELQQRFWSLLEVREPNEEFRPRMGAEFLRQNRELLD